MVYNAVILEIFLGSDCSCFVLPFISVSGAALYCTVHTASYALGHDIVLTWYNTKLNGPFRGTHVNSGNNFQDAETIARRMNRRLFYHSNGIFISFPLKVARNIIYIRNKCKYHIYPTQKTP